MAGLELFAAKVFLFSTGGGLVTRQLRSSIFGDEDECPAYSDIEADDLMARYEAAVLAPPDDWSFDGDATASVSIEPFGLLIPLAQRTALFWLWWAAGALAALALGLACGQRLCLASPPRYKLIVKGTRCTLLETGQGNASTTWPHRSDAIAFAEEHVQAVLRRTGACSACLVVNA